MIPVATSSIPAVSEEAPRKRRRRSCFVSCFGPPAVLDSAASCQTKVSASSGDGRPRKKHMWRTRLWWSMFRAKKTVPVDVAVAGASPLRSEEEGAGSPEQVEKKKSTGNSLFRRLAKIRSEKDHNLRPNRHQHIQQISINSNGGVHHIASKCSTRVEPVSLYCMHDHDQTRVGTRISHPGSPVAGHRARGNQNFGPSSGLLVLAVALAMLLVGGLICAIVGVCAWFYLLPQARQPSLLDDATISDYGSRGGEVDVSSEEHKKMVVLQGLLQRDGRRRPSRI